MTFSFQTPIQAGKSNISCLLKFLVTARDKNESTCIIALTYLLEVANANKEIFEYIISLPSPFIFYANFYDWIFITVDHFVKAKNKAMTYATTYSLAQHFKNRLKENLLFFEDNIRA